MFLGCLTRMTDASFLLFFFVVGVPWVFCSQEGGLPDMAACLPALGPALIAVREVLLHAWGYVWCIGVSY